MEKVLSIIVPTYNLASLLPQCLDSLVESAVLDSLDVLVVNDGSTDASREVAYSYVNAHPGSIRLIDKANGNYGSTINAALPLACGEYVKILDADDRFDPAALKEYVGALAGLGGKADVSVTHFLSVGKDGRGETIRYNVYGRKPYTYGRIYSLDKVLGDGYIRFFLMHSLAYRTEMLREQGYRQSEGISYTDTQWASYPLFRAESIVFHDLVVYRYNLGREGQTMDPAVIRKSLPQLEKMTFDMLDFYRNARSGSLSAEKQAFFKQYFRNRIRLLEKTHLMDIPREDFDPEAFAVLDGRLGEAVREFGMEPVRLFPENKILRIDAVRYFHKHHSRLPAGLESFSRFLDTAVKKIFAKVFH
ncbi:MAG: glycosyltransferase family 2 protein [Candidatus Cryptobacteroides sp.]